ncbi:MAG TPA: hypothetical protein VKJ45_17310 [Blastocatellia bacterium]|nr:hypothetical protein [Blastocatellia bacterium]
MQEISCKGFNSLLAEYVDGGLKQDIRKGMAGHSLQCRSCRALLDDVKLKLKESGRDVEIVTNPRLEAVLEAIPECESDLNCSSFEDLISDFLDGFVHASVYHRFAHHSDVCVKCSRVLTDVVYAVAACHSVHIYEEHEVPQSLEARLSDIGRGTERQAGRVSVPVVTGLRPKQSSWPFESLKAGLYRLLPTTSVERVATVTGLLLASVAMAMFGPAKDAGVLGMLRRAQSRATSIYSQKEIVEARFERVGEDLGKVWKALGGTDSMDGGDDNGTSVPGREQTRAGQQH